MHWHVLSRCLSMDWHDCGADQPYFASQWLLIAGLMRPVLLQPLPSPPPAKPTAALAAPQRPKPAANATQPAQQQKPGNATQPAQQQQKPGNGTQPAQQQQKPGNGTQPAQHPAKPAANATHPAQPAANATQPAQQAKPGAKPAQQPAKPAVNATQPAQQRPKPATNTTQPAQQPAKPIAAVGAAKTGGATAAVAAQPAAAAAPPPAAPPSPPVKPVAVAAAAADDETVPQFVPFDVGVTNAAAPSSRFVVLTWAVSASWNPQLLGFKVKLEQEGAAAGSFTAVPSWDGSVVQTRLDGSRPTLPAFLKQRTVVTETTSSTHYRMTIRVDTPTAGPRVRVQIQSALADGSFSTPMVITSAS